MRPLWFCLLFSVLLHAIVFGFALPSREPHVGVAEGEAFILKVEGGRASGRSMANGVGRDMARTELELPALGSSSGVQHNEKKQGQPEREGGNLAESVRYYPTEVLTRRPEALSEVRLEGELFSGVRLTDRAILDLWVEVDGQVSRVEVVASDYPEALTSELRGAFGRLLFRPGEVDGRGVSVNFRIEASYGAMINAPQ